MGMSERARTAFGLAAFLGLGLATGDASAQCCPGYSLATACSGQTLTKSRWCIQNTVPTGQKALPVEFCSYGDKVIATLEMVFNIQAQGIFEFELDTQTGGAHTGTACSTLGNGTAYDAFAGSAYGATYFWGYLLSLHEAINDWTGMSSGGWPTDWWADHQSAFPNLMDFHIMSTIGIANNDPNLIKAAAAQKGRFYPKGDTADPKVVALDNVYAAMPNGDGFAGFSHLFAMQSGDGVSWDALGVANPDVKRSEYVAAYMSLAAEQAVLTMLQGPGANGGGNICNGTPDGTVGDAPYTCSEAHIDAIANAHCSIAANGKPAMDLAALRSGNYTNVKSGPCASTCPSECACDTSNNCVAGWLVHGAPDAGSSGSGANGATGAMSGASSGRGGSGTNTASGASGGGLLSGSGAASAGSGAGAGASAGNGAGAGTSSGDNAGASVGASAGAASGASAGVGASGSTGTSTGAGAGVGATSTPPHEATGSGCGCRAVGGPPMSWRLIGLFGAVLVGLRLARRRARAR
jgi:hypothetical protein